ncbi:DUF2946 domain-containing protein [Pseudomonas sp. CDFA 602]|uniref:DUF2946 domain-containing protein n=1 Tax=Pseudomonas californiensis TaxID=2829823 RepID=UPI001E632400|nr:DUF2946 domain-containing protein [Pseudomonas californiensis]MCD5996689.1 DUF2946 domain-containing protein [Pseudomonas californiensis]MCD6002240.1 DUF2946 domain-containing protein [Pseudomonas californiensis]
MASLKRISPWIACLVILLNMLAMPLSRAMQTPDVRLMLWGGFCSSGTTHTLPESFNRSIDDLQMPSSKMAMQHGDCCCGHAGLAAIPSNYYRHFLPQYTPDTALDNPELPKRHPRVHWPALNPRASPFA